MTTGDFDTYYSDEPWSIMDKNQREWYDPDLIDIWRQKSVFRPLMTFTKNLEGVRATKMHITQLLDPHPDFTTLSARQIWLTSMHVDSREVEITFQHNGAKVAYHKYDDMVTYWRQNGQAGIRRIMRGALGTAEVDINDLLARNALISGALTTGYVTYAGSGATDFNTIGAEDLFDPDVASDIWLGMTYRGVPGAMNPSGAGGTIVCYTSPGVIYNIQKDASWISTRQYLQDRILVQYEVGQHKNVRYVQTPKCVLWNCGAITVRAPVSAAINAGDGAPNPGTTKVDGTYKVGQTSAGIVHYIQLGVPTSGSMSQFAVNDMVTIHGTVTSDFGVTNGVDYREGKAVTRRVVAVDVGNRRLVLDQPILVDFATDLGGGTYAYVTKGRHIHASIFVGGPEAIVAGVAQPPRYYTPQPVDDFDAIQRFTFDQYMGYQPYRPEVFEVVFSSGATRIKGATVAG